jgi:hypothetical protein
MGLFFTALVARAEDKAVPSGTAPQSDSAAPSASAPAEEVYLPGSPKPYGLGLSPEAPLAGPAPGGRAPSSGTPVEKDEWTFRLGGRISAFQVAGIGRKPSETLPGYKGTALHMPALIQGRQPFWPYGGMSLYMTYGNPLIQATMNYFAAMPGQEFRGWYNPYVGPTIGQAFVTVTPPAFGKTLFQSKVGAFTEIYGGVGQWGWGIFGPLLGVRGYGETMTLQHELNSDIQLVFTHGVSIVPQVAENYPRGDYLPWINNAMSSFVQHAHATVNYKGRYSWRLHAAQINGTNEETFLVGGALNIPRDGRIRALVLETHTQLDPYGSFGLSGALYDFKHAFAVNDGLWWGVDWTQGGRELTNKLLGTGTSGQGGTGTVAALSAEWDFSMARIMWHPRSFDGRSPDVRGRVAGIRYFTLDTDQPSFKGTGGYLLGLELEWVMRSWVGTLLDIYGESRFQPNQRCTYQTDGYGNTIIDAQGIATCITPAEPLGPYRVFSITPGFAFHSNWGSLDAIMVAYTRRFYSHGVDFNPAQPLDRDVISLGVWSSF